MPDIFCFNRDEIVQSMIMLQPKNDSTPIVNCFAIIFSSLLSCFSSFSLSLSLSPTSIEADPNIGIKATRASPIFFTFSFYLFVVNVFCLHWDYSLSIDLGRKWIISRRANFYFCKFTGRYLIFVGINYISSTTWSRTEGYCQFKNQHTTRSILFFLSPSFISS